jgi:hypothetical protein
MTLDSFSGLSDQCQENAGFQSDFDFARWESRHSADQAEKSAENAGKMGGVSSWGAGYWLAHVVDPETGEIIFLGLSPHKPLAEKWARDGEDDLRRGRRP